MNGYDDQARQLAGFAAAHLRGGSWNNNNVNARAANRNNNHPANRNNNIGFRVLAMRPTPLVPLQWLVAWAAGESSTFYQVRRLPVLLAE